MHQIIFATFFLVALNGCKAELSAVRVSSDSKKDEASSGQDPDEGISSGFCCKKVILYYRPLTSIRYATKLLKASN